MSESAPRRRDEEHWLRLAHDYGIRLPRSDAKFGTAGLKRCVRKAGLELSDYLRWGGYTRARDFIDMNPGWSLREFQGLMLEERAERDAA